MGETIGMVETIGMMETIGLMETMRDGGGHEEDGDHQGLYGLWWMVGAVRDGGEHEGWGRPLG